MANPNRSRFLGDVGRIRPARLGVGRTATGPSADGLLMLYATDPGCSSAGRPNSAQQLGKSGITGTTELPARELGDTEPFGFHDGISQPIIAGLPKAAQAMRTVPAGEFILGYPNARGQLTGRPLLPASEDPGRLLLPDPTGSGAVDFGRNGTYLVFRQLEQDVEGFWQFVDAGSPGERTDRRTPAIGPRWRPRWSAAGPAAPRLSKRQTMTPRRWPTITTSPTAATRAAWLARSAPTSAGPTPVTRWAPGPPPPSTPATCTGCCAARAATARPETGPVGQQRDRAVLHLPGGRPGQAIRIRPAHLAEQPTFNGLYDDADPLTGRHHPAGATFTVPARPVRHRYRGLPQFVRTRGGAYFFLPGVSACVTWPSCATGHSPAAAR